MSIVSNSQILVSVASKNGMGAMSFVDQFSDEPIVSVKRHVIPEANAELVAYALVSDVFANLPKDTESAAISVPSSVYPRLREAQKLFEEGIDAEDVKTRVIKSWIKEKDSLLVSAIGEAIDNLARIENPVLLLKNLNAFRFELNPKEAFVAGLKDGQEIDIKDGIGTVDGKDVHVLGYKGYTGHVKVSVRGEFSYKDGTKGVNASILRPEYAGEDGEEFYANGKADDALENWRLLVLEAAKVLNRVKKATVRK